MPSKELPDGDLLVFARKGVTRFLKSFSQSEARKDRGSVDLAAKYQAEGKKLIDSMSSGQIFTEMMNDLERTNKSKRSEYNKTDRKRVADLYELFVFLEWQWRAGGPLEDPTHPVLRLLPKVQVVGFLCACESKPYFDKLPIRVSRQGF